VTGQYPSLAGLRILVVEDDTMVSMMIEETLHELHCAVIPALPTVDTALQAIRVHEGTGGGTIDGVLLDLHLRGQSAFPVVDALLRCSLPFIIISGSGSGAEPSSAASAPRLTKPFTLEGLARRMAEVFCSPRDRAQRA
jgi:DNA-binding response OmpR family regulator